MKKEKYYLTRLQISEGILFLLKSKDGICFISSPQNGEQEVASWLEKYAPQGRIIEDETYFKIEKCQLSEYFAGKRSTFSFKFAFIGTPFQQTVWKTLSSIPYGETRTYTEVANMMNNKQAVRAVASAIAKNPLLIVVPCHRVVHKKNSIVRYRAGASFKQYLLCLERKETVIENKHI